MSNFTHPKEHTGLLENIRATTGWDKRTQRGSSTPLNYCMLCGREVKVEAAVAVLFNHNNGEIVDWDENADPDIYSIYDVGSACARKLRGVVLPPKSEVK